MIRLPLILALGLFPLAACAAAGSGEPVKIPHSDGSCEAGPGQAFVGRKATAEIGRQLLEATGARVIRWVPPRTAVTMDFRADRLTVSYDDDMVIERVSCT
ncbi:MAG: hypothetical protein H6R45_959 [Proteobacteria bacterium]|nr:hypothetical protein [Pseudomonadota bacterium]